MESIFSRSLAGSGEGNKSGGVGCFLPRPAKMFYSQNEKKLKGKLLRYRIDQNTYVHYLPFLCQFGFFFSLTFVSSLCNFFVYLIEI